MKYTAQIDVMPLKEILDPQGKAVALGLKNLGFKGIEQVRVGKHISIELEAENETEALAKAEEACNQLLANKIMEEYNIELRKD